MLKLIVIIGVIAGAAYIKMGPDNRAKFWQKGL
jgi:hypothetical protein